VDEANSFSNLAGKLKNAYPQNIMNCWNTLSHVTEKSGCSKLKLLRVRQKIAALFCSG
jgi:hypothetical protein